MVAKPKSASWFSSNKKILIVVGVCVAVCLLGFLYYQSQRPNYRDLEKAYNQLEIPADWTLVSSTSNKGTLGLFCLQTEGEECPYLMKKFTVQKRGTSAETNQALMMFLDSNSISKTDYDAYGIRCADSDLASGNYYCRFRGLKDSVQFSVAQQGSEGKDTLTIVITRKE